MYREKNIIEWIIFLCKFINDDLWFINDNIFTKSIKIVSKALKVLNHFLL